MESRTAYCKRREARSFVQFSFSVNSRSPIKAGTACLLAMPTQEEGLLELSLHVVE